MADRDVTGLLRALASFVATATSLIFEPQPGELRQIGVLTMADGAGVDDPLMVIRIGSGSPRVFDPFERMSIQFLTRGSNQESALIRAQRVHDVFLDAQRRPLRQFNLNAHWRIAQIDVSLPQVVGTDEQGRFLISSNAPVQAGLLPEGP